MAELEELLTATILALETELLRPETRASKHRLRELLSADFLEIGRSGRTYDRRAVIASLLEEKRQEVAVSDFGIRVVADGIVLATYRSRSDGLEPCPALRSSLWRREDGRWRMVFHQGTPDPAE